MAAVPSCAASAEELHLQRERMRALGPSVIRYHRAEDRVTIEFSPELDDQLLDETLAVERECCPFFAFNLDERERRLTVSVADAEHRAGLDALVHALGVRPPTAW